jgi:hypothetical protein
MIVQHLEDDLEEGVTFVGPANQTGTENLTPLTTNLMIQQ